MSAPNNKEIVVIIDYGSGNLRSAAKAFEHVIAAHNLNFDVLVSSKAEDVARASHIVLPGQGAFGDCMQGLQGVEGMIEALEEAFAEGIETGHPDMPVFKVSLTQLQDILSYIEALQKP